MKNWEIVPWGRNVTYLQIGWYIFTYLQIVPWEPIGKGVNASIFFSFVAWENIQVMTYDGQTFYMILAFNFSKATWFMLW